MERLGISYEEFLSLTPHDLAWQLWGERRRHNLFIRDLVWAVSFVVSPHVDKKDRSKISVRRLHMALGDLDEDEMLGE